MEVPYETLECDVCRELLTKSLSLSDGSSLDFCCVQSWTNDRGKNEMNSPMTLVRIDGMKIASRALMRFTNAKDIFYVLKRDDTKKWTMSLRKSILSQDISGVIMAIAHGASVESLEGKILNSAFYAASRVSYHYFFTPVDAVQDERERNLIISKEIFKILFLNGAKPETLYIFWSNRVDILKEILPHSENDKFKILLENGLDPMFRGGWFMFQIWSAKRLDLFDLFLGYITCEIASRGWRLCRIIHLGTIDEIKSLVGETLSIRDFSQEWFLRFTLLELICYLENEEIFEFIHTRLLSDDEEIIFKIFYHACARNKIARMRGINERTPVTLVASRKQELFHLCFYQACDEGMRYLAEIGVDVVEEAKTMFRNNANRYYPYYSPTILTVLFDLGLDVNFDDGLLLNGAYIHSGLETLELVMNNPKTDKSLLRKETLILLVKRNVLSRGIGNKDLKDILEKYPPPREYLEDMLEKKHEMDYETLEIMRQALDSFSA
jgi:hypothetical protein